jgi:nicotinate-nucleotide pyrophosphorylase
MNLKEQALEQVGNIYDSVVGNGDITTEIMFPYPRHTVAEVSTNLSTPSFVFDFLEEAVKCADESILIRKFYEGDLIQSGEKAVQLEGNGRAILTAWQVAAPLMDLAVAVMAKVGDAQEQLQPARIDATHRLDLDNSTDKIIKYVLEQSGAALFGSRLDEIIHITLEHGRWVGSAKEAAEKAIAEAGDIRKLIKIIVDMDSIEEAASLLDMQIDYVWCRGFSAENIRSMGESTKGWLHMIIDESIPLNEAKTLRDAGVRLYALDFSLTKINESTFNINFTK